MLWAAANCCRRVGFRYGDETDLIRVAQGVAAVNGGPAVPGPEEKDANGIGQGWLSCVGRWRLDYNTPMGRE